MSASKFSLDFTNSKKNWVEICDEDGEPQDFIQNVYRIVDQCGEVNDEDSIHNMFTLTNSQKKGEESSIENESASNSCIHIQTKTDKECSDNEIYDYIFTANSIAGNIKTEPTEENDPDDSSECFSYANVVRSSGASINDHVTQSLPISPKKKFALDGREFPAICSDQIKKKIKTEKQDHFLEDDISLSSHLDVFHMASPCKLKESTDEECSPDKRRIRLAKRRNIVSSTNEADRVMHQSEKIISFFPQEISEKNFKDQNNLKRRRQADFNKNYNQDHQEIEYETDPFVLYRRQKQIDYGKNTVGYDRYRRLVPIERRHKKHPSTPLKHVKYSRRAWDGLVRVWRQQLHFWDPPSNGTELSDTFDLGSSDLSSGNTSDQGSLPSTPDWKKWKGEKRVRVKKDSNCSSTNDHDDMGCHPIVPQE